ncbi:MAG: HNH endonuclease [Bacteroidia bacterium]
MKWFKIEKKIKPSTGKYYSDWKDHLAEEAKGQCVYCTIHLNPFGGIRNFHVEHYKPKSVQAFKHLEHDYNNLFLACSICNCFKGADWPNEPNDLLDIKCYPDPTVVDYSTLFEVNSDYTLSGTKFASKYMVTKLFLNRPQLQLERKAFALYQEIKEVFNNLKDLINQLKAMTKEQGLSESEALLYKTMIKTVEFTLLQNEEKFIVPYITAQITK